jgi:hypothetical protein
VFAPSPGCLKIESEICAQAAVRGSPLENRTASTQR